MLVPRLAVRPEDIKMSVSLRRGDSLESQRVRRVLTRCRESAWSPETSIRPEFLVLLHQHASISECVSNQRRGIAAVSLSVFTGV
ncbi:hypothetical protein CesoFtcFv8_021340 [Champsocephalus esox]|uniref:Uncharacterized protein n=2 Tax=Champsocephalus TaxID=52236 RepID=A0AAN8HBA5_CHAGU|nr:hypothetical protein CesoFtcFv8_021340 [Champsocephalus esox]KAK5908842.1 hypothetical protein CgunFtcFv8_016865 [Champsocephalus gunnari]